MATNGSTAGIDFDYDPNVICWGGAFVSVSWYSCEYG